MVGFAGFGAQPAGAAREWAGRELARGAAGPARAWPQPPRAGQGILLHGGMTGFITGTDGPTADFLFPGSDDSSMTHLIAGIYNEPNFPLCGF